jgi:hypothetical protein
MRKRVYVALAVLLVMLVGVIGWQVLHLREPIYRSLEVRLHRLTSDDTPPGDFLDKLRWMVPPSTQAWTAVFEIRNPWGRTIGVNQMMRDAVIVDRDSRADASYAGLHSVSPQRSHHAVCYLRPHERMEQAICFSVPPESTMCRFRVVYWPATARERWRLLSAKWALARRYPSFFNWVSMHLPDTRRECEAMREVCLPAEPELLPDEERAHNEPRQR